jgi:hypothetical protein
VAEAQEKLHQIEALAAGMSIHGDSSRVTPTSDLKRTGIRCKKLNEPIVVKEQVAKEPKIAKNVSSAEFLFRGGSSAIRIFIGLSKGQIPTLEHSNQAQMRLATDAKKQSPIEGHGRRQQQRENAPPRSRHPQNSRTEPGSDNEFENAKSIGPSDDLARSGVNEIRYEPESVVEESHPVLSRGEGLRVMVSDGESRDGSNGGFLIGDRDQADQGSDGERSCDCVKVPEMAAGRSISGINSD